MSSEFILFIDSSKESNETLSIIEEQIEDMNALGHYINVVFCKYAPFKLPRIVSVGNKQISLKNGDLSKPANTSYDFGSYALNSMKEKEEDDSTGEALSTDDMARAIKNRKSPPVKQDLEVDDDTQMLKNMLNL